MKEKEKRHVNSVHLALVLLVAMAVIFVITLVLAFALPRRTVKTDDSIASEVTSKPMDTPEETKAPSYEGGTEEISTEEKNTIASLIQKDLSSQISGGQNITVNASDITFTAGSSEIEADGTFTYRKDGKQYSRTFSYTFQRNGSDSYQKSGSSLGQASLTKDSSSSDKSGSSGKKAAEPTDLSVWGSYDVNVTSSIQVTASASDGEIRVDATDSTGNTATVYDKTGTFDESVTVPVDPGSYTITLYGKGGKVSFTAQ